MNRRLDDLDALFNGVTRTETLRELFDKKLEELKLKQAAVLKILGLQYRALNQILDGTQKMVDATALIKIAHFLRLPKEQVFKLYLDEVERRNPVEAFAPEKIKFIKENFDLAVLKKAGLIDSITDFSHIEKKLLSRLGLRSLFEYKKPSVDIAFSSARFKPENNSVRAFWIKAAIACFEELDNPYRYDREALIKFFPQIRWHTMNVERGLLEVIRGLYRIGVTVLFQPPLQTLQLRGATFNINEKPCIVLTNYVGFYATLWFALVHELYHVLFDWEEIKAHKYHLTDDSNDQLSVQEREKEADAFARDYLFSNDKLLSVRSYINDETYIADFAAANHVHPSIIYTFNAVDANSPKAWALVRKKSPHVADAIRQVDLPWPSDESFEEILAKRRTTTYN